MADKPRVDGRAVVITGSTGIAAAAAERLAMEGASVFVVSRDPAHASELAGRVGGGWAAADLTMESDVERAIAAAHDQLGRLDGLLSVAGGSGRRFGDGPVHTVTADGWDRTLALNLRSQALVAGAVTRRMLASGGGSIVLVSSVLASRPVPSLFGTHAYAAAKGAIESLARSMAAMYATDRIRVNVIAPGLTRTPMSTRAAEDPTTAEFVTRKQPLIGGFVDPADVADAAVYLLSDEARAITGQVLAVDGGWSVTDVEAQRP